MIDAMDIMGFYCFYIFGVILIVALCIAIVISLNHERNNKSISTTNRDNNNNNNDSVRKHISVDRPTPCYEDGEITNPCVMIALKNIKRELKNQLSPLEKDAIDKAIKNTISIEKLYNFIDLKI